MIEEQALVIALEQDMVVVQTQRTASCGSCSTDKGCDTSVLAKGIGRAYTELRVISDLEVKVGDRVILAIEESAILKGAVMIYLLPLTAMILSGLLGDYCSGYLALTNELLTIVFGIAGLVGGVMLNRFNPYAQRIQQGIQPKIIEIV